MWFERNVMHSVCIRFECSGRVTDGFPKKKNMWIGFELYPIFFGIFGKFLTLQSPLSRLKFTDEYDSQMHFNPLKCFVMRLTHARHTTRFNYILGDKSLQETDNHPYLGVDITKDLTRNKHIHQITATANRTLACVRRNLYSCPQHVKYSAYTTLVRPLIEYSLSVWDPHTKNGK